MKIHLDVALQQATIYFTLFADKLNRSDGQVVRTSASDAVEMGSIFESGQAKGFKKLHSQLLWVMFSIKKE